MIVRIVSPQLFPRPRVDTNKPGAVQRFRQVSKPGGSIHHEEVCVDSFTCTLSGSCGLHGAGCGQDCAACPCRRTLRSPPASRLHVDRGLPALGRRSLRLGSGPLGSSAPSRCALGCSPLGSPQRRIRDGRRPLAVNLAPTNEGEAKGLAFIRSASSRSALIPAHLISITSVTEAAASSARSISFSAIA